MRTTKPIAIQKNKQRLQIFPDDENRLEEPEVFIESTFPCAVPIPPLLAVEGFDSLHRQDILTYFLSILNAKKKMAASTPSTNNVLIVDVEIGAFAVITCPCGLT